MAHDDHDKGLLHDLLTLAERKRERRSVLRWAAGTSVIALVGCGTETSDGGESGECSEIPEETQGPYPGDGSNGVNALALSGIVRSDIRSSVGDASGVAEGVVLTVTLTIVDAGGDCEPLTGRAVYIWHCDRAGDYSLYTGDAAGENYLRGVQQTDGEGRVTFTTIFPACYSGRWPHIHFEVYSSLDEATSSESDHATSQLALPEDVCAEVYAVDGYEQSVDNLSQISLESDNVFSDGVSLQMATVSGDVESGYTATLIVAVEV
ncbi:MAG: intradiol ring-cleavage dioxygenase [Polyangiaceae bacterium]|nr:intradiol ring-cleavage dioxygenase [Polyangiaceae bacterium]